MTDQEVKNLADGLTKQLKHAFDHLRPEPLRTMYYMAVTGTIKTMRLAGIITSEQQTVLDMALLKVFHEYINTRDWLMEVTENAE